MFPGVRRAFRQFCAATILQSLLGNIGRPGGGILALRGHASIQGSIDVPTLNKLLPGYLNAPSALKNHDTLADYIETEIIPTSYWYHFPKFIVSLLTAWLALRPPGRMTMASAGCPATWATIRICRCSLPCPKARSTGSWRWARTRPWAARTRRCTPRPGQARLAGRQGPVRDRDRHVLD